MDRLIKRIGHGIVMPKSMQLAMERLAAYEDTGLEPDEIPHWIPVSERLPEVNREPSGYVSDCGTQVIICDEDKNVFVANFWKIAKIFTCTNDNSSKIDVIYWQPLPQTPKGEKS